jgi:hypothetical protein
MLISKVNGSGRTVLLVLSWQVEVLFIFGAEFIMAEKTDLVVLQNSVNGDRYRFGYTKY